MEFDATTISEDSVAFELGDERTELCLCGRVLGRIRVSVAHVKNPTPDADGKVDTSHLVCRLLVKYGCAMLIAKVQIETENTLAV